MLHDESGDFRFNFRVDADEQTIRVDESPPPIGLIVRDEYRVRVPAREHPYVAPLTSLLTHTTPLRLSADVILAVVVVADAPFAQESDVIPGVYEGGLKVWEGTADLIRYIAETKTTELSRFVGGDVADIGCGHGLVGVFALTALNANTLTMTDFNADVITAVTAPTLRHNAHDRAHRCTLISGDWNDDSLIALLTHNHTRRYDLIISAETIYSPLSLRPLVSLLERTLSRSGRALIAAKRYYFGVGGSVAALCDYIRREERMTAQIIRTIDDGHSNIREIVQIEWTQSA